MLKIVGISLILLASVLFGFQLKWRLSEHIKQLIGLKEILLMLSGEISYTRTPISQAFVHIAQHGKEPFGSILTEVAERMEEERAKKLKDIWKSVIEQHREQIYFTEAEFALLEELGGNFGYLDAQMQLKHIALSMEQIDTNIRQAQEELAVKQKMYQYLSVMCGLFLILILV